MFNIEINKKIQSSLHTRFIGYTSDKIAQRYISSQVDFRVQNPPADGTFILQRVLRSIARTTQHYRRLVAGHSNMMERVVHVNF
jgi:hypothetical protein